jgi:hypothetical protein
MHVPAGAHQNCFKGGVTESHIMVFSMQVHMVGLNNGTWEHPWLRAIHGPSEVNFTYDIPMFMSQSYMLHAQMSVVLSSVMCYVERSSLPHTKRMRCTDLQNHMSADALVVSLESYADLKPTC